MRIVVHAGGEKTGSTSIQHALFLAGSHLAQEGFYLPDFLAHPALPAAAHTKLAVYAADFEHLYELADLLGLRGRRDHESFRQDIRRQWREFAEKVPADSTVVISSEHLSSRLTTMSAASTMAEFLLEVSDDVQIVLYLKRQDRFAVSKAATTLTALGILDLAAQRPWSEGLDNSTYFDYASLVSRLDSVLGNQRVKCVPMGLGRGRVRDSLAHFWRHGTLPRQLLQGSINENESPRLSRAAITVLQRMAACSPPVPPGKAITSLISWLEEVSPGPGIRAVLARQEAADFVDVFRVGNEQIARRLGLVDGLFDDDYSEYPEVPEQSPVDDEVDILIRMVGVLAQHNGQLAQGSRHRATGAASAEYCFDLHTLNSLMASPRLLTEGI